MHHEGTSAPGRLAVAIGLIVLSGTWAWWAAKEGAYFGAVLYPGVVLLCAGLLLVSSKPAWPSRLSLTLPARLALGSLLALGAWSALSATWSPTPEIAVADGQRILGYAVAFALGLWLATQLRERVHLALVPVAVAGLVAGSVALLALLTGDDYDKYIDAGTLQHPLGYRNGNAAFFLIALWPAVMLATVRDLDWRLRALALGTATLCLELAMLSQSRGSTIAVAVALVVLLVASRERARAVGWLALAVIPALIVIPALTDLYQTRELEDYAGTAEIRGAGRAALGGALLALTLGIGAALAGRRVTPSPDRRDRANRMVAAGAVAAAVAAALAFTIASGDPVGWIDDRVDEFLTQGTPHEKDVESRFGVNAGSERDDLWRVALEVAEDDPIAGTGGGGYKYEYLVHRSEEGIESAQDAHSVELEILSELGVPGLLLFATAVGGAIVGAWRSRFVSPAHATLAAGALVAGAYWLAHTSLDWFWTYPAITAPVVALLGSACVAPNTEVGTAEATRLRLAAAAATVVLALSVVPAYLAERYVDSAYAEWRTDPDRAFRDLERARDLNPLSLEPLLAEGGIARAMGDRRRAIAAFEEAARERPEEWATHYFLANLHRRTDPRRARLEFQLARELNPYSKTLDELGERFPGIG